MGRLITIGEFCKELLSPGLSPTWYFPDAKFVPKGNSATLYWEYTITSGYPACHYIPFRHLGLDHRRDGALGHTAAGQRVMIRRWIERNLDGDVIHTIDDRTYVLPFNDMINHGYHVFHFETDGDANHFLLRFVDLVELPTEYDETDALTLEYWSRNGQQKFWHPWR